VGGRVAAVPAGYDDYLEAIEDDLRRAALPFGSESLSQLSEMIAYHHGWLEEQAARGKRVRPLITVLACHACGGDWRHALPAASAVELVHNFSLIHDDIEDHSDKRRGRPTLWTRVGVPQALNTGDALFALARLSLYRLHDQHIPTQTILSIQHELDQACLALTQGQYLDIAFETREVVDPAEYIDMVEGKTAALLTAATTMGARVALAARPQVQQLARFGRNLGLAFQMQDDILGIWGDSSVTGKPSGDDLLSRKKTLPTLLGLKRSKAFRSLWAHEAADPNRLPSMRAELESCGALEHTQADAARYTDLALSALAEASPAEPAGSLLQSLTRQMLGRQR
jgi:geranylgeranyl diphosphate synthase type I